MVSMFTEESIQVWEGDGFAPAEPEIRSLYGAEFSGLPDATAFSVVNTERFMAYIQRSGVLPTGMPVPLEELSDIGNIFKLVMVKFDIFGPAHSPIRGHRILIRHISNWTIYRLDLPEDKPSGLIRV